MVTYSYKISHPNYNYTCKGGGTTLYHCPTRDCAFPEILSFLGFFVPDESKCIGFIFAQPGVLTHLFHRFCALPLAKPFHPVAGAECQAYSIFGTQPGPNMLQRFTRHRDKKETLSIKDFKNKEIFSTQSVEKISYRLYTHIQRQESIFSQWPNAEGKPTALMPKLFTSQWLMSEALTRKHRVPHCETWVRQGKAPSSH